MSAHEQPKPIGGDLLAPPMKTLLVVFAVSLVIMLYRFFTGVGAVSAMNDGFAWGIWEPLNVVTFTGIGAGAFGLGLITYLLNRGEYHGLVRPAVLVGAIAYTLGGTSIMIALGRYWNAILLPVVPFWNLSSALLEVAVCVMVYICVLWVEVLPSIFERIAAVRSPWWAAFGERWGKRLAAMMPYIIAFAILLPTMHQSSLGGLMLITESKVHPLWHSALLPLLFLVSCLSMGYGTVVTLVTILRLTWNAKQDMALLSKLSRVNAALIVAYVVLRLGDLAWNGKLHYFGLNAPTLLFAFEMALFLAPVAMILTTVTAHHRGQMFGAALLSVAAGAVYRMDTYLTMFRPGPGWRYFPSIGETVVTVGMAAFGIALFIFICRVFPVVVVEDRKAPRMSAKPPVKVAAHG